VSVDQKFPPPSQPGAPQARPYSLMPGLRALASLMSHHSYPVLQSMAPCVASWLDSAPSVEFVFPPISTFRIWRSAPMPGAKR
jgi:hypothetical protein